MTPCFEVQKQEKPVSCKKVAQCFWLFYKQLHFYISLLFHPMMNSINLDLFKASVGETTIFVVVTAVHSGAECFSWLRPQSWIWRTQNIMSAFQTLQRDSGILIVHKTSYLLLQLHIFSPFGCKGKGHPSLSVPWASSQLLLLLPLMLLVQALVRILQPAYKPHPAAPKPLNLCPKACTSQWDPLSVGDCPQRNDFGASSLGAMDLALPLLLSSQTRAGADD